MRWISFISLVALLGCSSKQGARYVCSCDQRENIQKFIERSIKPSNNMSDEEMEDVIRELWVTGVKMNCSQKIVSITSSGYVDWEEVKIDSCQTFLNLSL